MQAKQRGSFYAFQLCNLELNVVAPADRLLHEAYVPPVLLGLLMLLSYILLYSLLKSGELEKQVQQYNLLFLTCPTCCHFFRSYA